jgi:hypothetical protein
MQVEKHDVSVGEPMHTPLMPHTHTALQQNQSRTGGGRRFRVSTRGVIRPIDPIKPRRHTPRFSTSGQLVHRTRTQDRVVTVPTCCDMKDSAGQPCHRRGYNTAAT